MISATYITNGIFVVFFMCDHVEIITGFWLIIIIWYLFSGNLLSRNGAGGIRVQYLHKNLASDKQPMAPLYNIGKG